MMMSVIQFGSSAMCHGRSTYFMDFVVILREETHTSSYKTRGPERTTSGTIGALRSSRFVTNVCSPKSSRVRYKPTAHCTILSNRINIYFIALLQIVTHKVTCEAHQTALICYCFALSTLPT